MLITDIERTKEDFGKIKPDISTKDFLGILFDKWRNIPKNIDTKLDRIPKTWMSVQLLCYKKQWDH